MPAGAQWPDGQVTGVELREPEERGIWGLWPLHAVHISVGGEGELYIAVPAGRAA